MLAEHPMAWCWACGAGGDLWSKPPDWFGPWLIERAHIRSQPRREDRRAVVLICSRCHKASHGERHRDQQGELIPRLEVEHLLELKATFDPAFYDREFLQKVSIRRLPARVQLPRYFLEAYAARRGNRPKTPGIAG